MAQFFGEPERELFTACLSFKTVKTRPSRESDYTLIFMNTKRNAQYMRTSAANTNPREESVEVVARGRGAPA